MAKKVEEAPDGGQPVASATTAGAHADVASMTYEQARDELVGLVARLENGQVGLEESMSLWQRGEVLATHCNQWLDRAEARISADD
jgi:exodeoxyribonuclease VII small subunit